MILLKRPMIIKKLNIFIIKSNFGPFILTFFIAIFVLLMQFLWKYIDDLVGKGLEWSVIAQLLFWASVTMVPLALPLAILLSSIMTFGNLGENYELAALKSAGISLQRIMLPLILLTFFISIVAFYFSNNALPYANLKMGSLLYDVREQKPALNIKEGIFYSGIDNYIIKVGKKDKDGVTIYNVMIYDHASRNGNTNLTLAEKGTMEMTEDKRFLVFQLYNGVNYYEKPDNYRRRKNYPLQRTSFTEEFRRFDLSGFSLTRTNEEFFKDNYQMMNLSQLKATSDSLQQRLDSIQENYQKNVHSNLYYFSRIGVNDSTFKDTSKVISGELLENFSQTEQEKIIEKALNSARNLKDHVFYNNEDINGRKKFIRRHDIEWQRKFTLSIACIVLFFIGAPLGAIIRKGGLGLPVVVSILFFVIFHVTSFTCEKMIRESILPPEGMWLPSLIFLPFGIFLTIKATSDSTLLDSNAYFDSIKHFFKKQKNTANISH